jgi:hypothetical protein
VVIGYSGHDDFDVSPILVRSKSLKGILWISHSTNRKLSMTSWNDLNTASKNKDRNFVDTYGNFWKREHSMLYDISKNKKCRENAFIIEIESEKVLNEIRKIYSLPVVGTRKPYDCDINEFIKSWAKNHLKTEWDKVSIITEILNSRGDRQLAYKCLHNIQNSIEIGNPVKGRISYEMGKILMESLNYSDAEVLFNKAKKYLKGDKSDLKIRIDLLTARLLRSWKRDYYAALQIIIDVSPRNGHNLSTKSIVYQISLALCKKC